MVWGHCHHTKLSGFHSACIGLLGKETSFSLQFRQVITEGLGRGSVARTFARGGVQAVENRLPISIWARQQSGVARQVSTHPFVHVLD